MSDHMVQMSVEQLWEAIYAARDSEKYWRRRRADYRYGVSLREEHYSIEELDEHYKYAKERTKKLEALAPAYSF